MALIINSRRDVEYRSTAWSVGVCLLDTVSEFSVCRNGMHHVGQSLSTPPHGNHIAALMKRRNGNLCCVGAGPVNCVDSVCARLTKAISLS